MRRLSTTFVALCVSIALGWFVEAGAQAAQSPTLRRLQGIDELKTWFNAGAGRPRLIFLLSPT
jgi:hypothetical protein